MASPFKTLLIATGIVLGVANLSPAAAHPQGQHNGHALVDITSNGITVQLNRAERQDKYRKHSERYSQRQNNRQENRRHERQQRRQNQRQQHRPGPSEYTDPARRIDEHYRELERRKKKQNMRRDTQRDWRRDEQQDWQRNWRRNQLNEFDQPRRPHGERYARCTPSKALRKVRRRGLRRAHVRRVNQRGVVIAARKRGERVLIGFGRHPSCPIRFVRAPRR